MGAVRCLAAVAVVLLGSASSAIANPMQKKSYGGCEGGFCPAEDQYVEFEFYQAAAAGDAAALRRILASPTLNVSRNTVPDSHGFARVVEVAVWAAVTHDRIDALQVLLEEGGLRPRDEEGHLVDLAAINGALPMLDFLLRNGFGVGPMALAHAANKGHAEVMQRLLANGKKLDMKAAMEAACATRNTTIVSIVMDAGGFDEVKHPVTGKQAQHDWRGQYATQAIKSGNAPVLAMLFDAGYTLSWKIAQEMVVAAVASGDRETLRLVMAQPTISGDEEDREEAVASALKMAAEYGHMEQVDLLLTDYTQDSKPPCPAATLQATRYGHFTVVQRLQALCNVTGTKLQDAAWLGHLMTAAKGGHAQVLELLLASDTTKARLAKRAELAAAARKHRAVVPGSSVRPGEDPLVEAAARGHTAAVQLLSGFRSFCAPCAAVAAARGGHVDIVHSLLEGPAETVLLDGEDHVQDALRLVADAMEGGHWDLVEWLIMRHESISVGSYFLPAIARHGRVQDMRRMLALMAQVDAGSEYLQAQLSSALVTAALYGHVDVVVAISESDAQRSAVLPS